ncbi:MAG: TM2 domain-containing protein [Clostridia bacterium]|nr:TM2 domain-containing protein [Clostridia bacterium]
MNENQAICLNCGVKTGDGNAFCQNCGNAVAPNAAVCLSCGVAIKKTSSVGVEGELGGQNKLMIALVCFFLGGIGIHNFIMGENKKGIFKIIMSFVCGIGGILALIDFIKILIGKYVVDPTKLI